LLMTANKFGSSYMHTLCRADEVDHIFSDAPVPEDIILKLRDR
jgi:DeoR/GlpR family transcriptional regulator of sugar metabolism